MSDPPRRSLAVHPDALGDGPLTLAAMAHPAAPGLVRGRRHQPARRAPRRDLARRRGPRSQGVAAPRLSANPTGRGTLDEFRGHNGLDQLTLHAHRDASLASQPGALLLATLGVVPSHSRPQVSDDSRCSEALFKTLAHRPDFPPTHERHTPTSRGARARPSRSIRVSSTRDSRSSADHHSSPVIARVLSLASSRARQVMASDAVTTVRPHRAAS